jgi:hypothetical protein
MLLFAMVREHVRDHGKPMTFAHICAKIIKDDGGDPATDELRPSVKRSIRRHCRA